MGSERGGQRRRTGHLAALVGTIGLVLLSGCVQRVSVATGGGEAHGGSGSDAPSMSAGGRFVAFESTATDLVPGDSNGVSDVFVHDRIAHTTERVSVATGGGEAHGASTQPSISEDGRFVAFQSSATDLVAGDTNALSDVFLHDRVSGATERVSITPAGAQIVGASGASSISGDGNRVAFESSASLVPGDINTTTDVYVRDRGAATTSLVSRFANGFTGQFVSSEPSFSADGHTVAFRSYVAFQTADTDNFSDIYVTKLDIAAQTPTFISAPAATANAFQPSVSGDGSVVAFAAATPRVDVFAYESPGGEVTRLSNGLASADPDNGSTNPSVNRTGRWIAFTSYATNLVPGDLNGAADVFRFDRVGGAVVRLSVNAIGVEGVGDSRGRADVSDDGTLVAFPSFAPNLPSDGVDANGLTDIVVKLVVG